MNKFLNAMEVSADMHSFIKRNGRENLRKMGPQVRYMLEIARRVIEDGEKAKAVGLSADWDHREDAPKA